MLNKQHEYILKAFLESRIPDAVRMHAPSVLVTDSVLEDCCRRLIRLERRFNVPDLSRVIGKDRDVLIGIASRADEYERDELMNYYRILMLTVSVLEQYHRE